MIEQTIINIKNRKDDSMDAKKSKATPHRKVSKKVVGHLRAKTIQLVPKAKSDGGNEKNHQSRQKSSMFSAW